MAQRSMNGRKFTARVYYILFPPDTIPILNRNQGNQAKFDDFGAILFIVVFHVKIMGFLRSRGRSKEKRKKILIIELNI